MAQMGSISVIFTIMPSWRKGQDTLSDEDFQQTVYYQTFQHLLTHPTLQKWIQEKGIHVSFYLLDTPHD